MSPKKFERQGDDEHDDENEKEDPCYPGGCHGNTPESEDAGDDRDNEEYQGPVQHCCLLVRKAWTLWLFETAKERWGQPQKARPMGRAFLPPFRDAYLHVNGRVTCALPLRKLTWYLCETKILLTLAMTHSIIMRTHGERIRKWGLAVFLAVLRCIFRGVSG